MNHWIESLQQRLTMGQSAVRVVVAAVRGSAPREAGAVMLVMKDGLEGTIGGGHLEWKAVAIARAMLEQNDIPAARADRFSLGATLGQCCGGAVELWFERFNASDSIFIAKALEWRERCMADGREALLLTSLKPRLERHLSTAELLTKDGSFPQADFRDPATAAALFRSADHCTLVERLNPSLENLWLFGAGHVGRALVEVLAGLPLRITWVDSREAILTPPVVPRAAAIATVCAEDPAEAVRDAPANAFFLILTHSHEIDYEICRALLSGPDFAWAGLIGSQTKAASFKARLTRQGYAPGRVARIACPIGVPGIENKLPAAIAVSVAAQLLSVIEAHRAAAKVGSPLLRNEARA